MEPNHVTNTFILDCKKYENNLFLSEYCTMFSLLKVLELRYD